MANKSGRKSGTEESEQGGIVEEKVTKVNGDISVRRYNKGKFLGKGGFARCYEFVALNTRKITAAKIVQKASLTKTRAKQKLMSEIKIHRSLHHPSIVGFEHFFEDSENVYILLEMCSNQTMSELIRRRKRLTELEAQCYLVQILSAVRYLHQHRVIHRDLKLGNLFLSEKMEIKIGDFGLATKLEFDGERKRTICGTPNYIAPEVLEGKSGHSYEVDVWAIGVILYTLLVGKPPFETSDVKTTYRRIRMLAYTFPETVAISEPAKSLIARILVTDPAKRPTIDDIMAHQFFHQGYVIPKLLPSSTLACPPSASYMKQFMQHVNPPSPRRLTETAPTSALGTARAASQGHFEVLNTDRIKLNRDSRPADQVPVPVSSLPDKPPVPAPVSQVEVWVKKWVDYSSKYGLGYLLSNGCTGVYFNDSSKILLGTNGHVFHYFERKGPERQEAAITYTLTDYPKDLQKKVTLLQHFRSYLEGDIRQETGVMEPNQPPESPIYIKKWMRTRHAILFRLTNKIVQVNFQDHTEIILSSESKTVTYVNKVGERSSYPLATALESPNAEMSKRLKYTKDILSQMVGGGPGTGATSGRNKSPGTERK